MLSSRRVTVRRRPVIHASSLGHGVRSTTRTRSRWGWPLVGGLVVGGVLAGIAGSATISLALSSGALAGGPAAPSHVDRPVPTPTLVEGHDYSFVAKVRGAPVAWSCAAPIEVTLVGDSPEGAHDVLILAVDELRAASHLPMVVSAPTPAGLRVDPSGRITVSFASVDAPDVLGRGGPIWDGQGTISAGNVTIQPTVDPTTPRGRHVLMHELAHAVGLGHAEVEDALMAPKTGPSARATLEAGDLHALAEVGCP